jgi:exopolysaccharide biosynthesis polyprenyl glycosylphosphotransferase
MIRRHATSLRALLMATDAALAIATLLLLSAIRFGQGGDAFIDPGLRDPIVPLTVYAGGWVAALASQGLYRVRARWTLRGLTLDVGRATVLFAIATLAFLFVFKLGDISRLLLVLLFPALAASAFVSRLAMRGLLTYLRDRGRDSRLMLVVGASGDARSFADLVESHHELGIRVIGHLSAAAGHLETGAGRPLLGTIDDIEEVLHSNIVDEVAICLPFAQWDRIDQLARLCEEEGKIVRIPMPLLERPFVAGRVEEFEGLPIYSVVIGPDRSIGLLVKRAVDVFGSAVLMVLLTPLIAVVAVLIRRDSPGPIIFRQVRVGLHGRPFHVLKFRTMRLDAEEQLEALRAANEIAGPAFKIQDDPRVTRVGRWLRRSSLDELPQLGNVLRGEMSLVGPRPPLPGEVSGYDVWHRRRLSMKPGMTGLWQVRSRGESDFDRWVETDLEYIDQWSLWLDLRILARTVPAVLNGQGR